MPATTKDINLSFIWVFSMTPSIPTSWRFWTEIKLTSPMEEPLTSCSWKMSNIVSGSFYSGIATDTSIMMDPSCKEWMINNS